MACLIVRELPSFESNGFGKIIRVTVSGKFQWHW